MIYLTGGKRGIFTFLRSLLGPAIRVDYKKGEYSAWVSDDDGIFRLECFVMLGHSFIYSTSARK